MWWDGVQAPPDGGHDRESPLGANKNVDLIAGFGKPIERVAGRVLASLWKTLSDEPSAICSQRKAVLVSRFPLHRPHRSIGFDDLQSVHPPPDAPVPYRAGAGGVRGDHSPASREQS